MKENDEIIAKRICPQYRSRYCYNECNWFGNCLDLEAGDSLDPDETFCSNCGVVHRKWVMFGISTGRNTKYLCPKCYLRGLSDSGHFTYGRVSVTKKDKNL